jgi:hypothetical protein
VSADVLPFVAKPKPDREALIRDARAIYEGVFPVDYTRLIEAPYVAPESDPA